MNDSDHSSPDQNNLAERGITVISPVLRGPTDTYKTTYNDIVDNAADPAEQAMRNEEEKMNVGKETEEELRARILAGMANILFEKHNHIAPSPEVVVRRLYALFFCFVPDLIGEQPSLNSVAGTLGITKQGLSKIKLGIARKLNARAQHTTTEKQRAAWSDAAKKKHAERKEEVALLG